MFLSNQLFLGIPMDIINLLNITITTMASTLN